MLQLKSCSNETSIRLKTQITLCYLELRNNGDLSVLVSCRWPSGVDNVHLPRHAWTNSAGVYCEIYNTHYQWNQPQHKVNNIFHVDPLIPRCFTKFLWKFYWLFKDLKLIVSSNVFCWDIARWTWVGASYFIILILWRCNKIGVGFCQLICTCDYQGSDEAIGIFCKGMVIMPFSSFLHMLPNFMSIHYMTLLSIY